MRLKFFIKYYKNATEGIGEDDYKKMLELKHYLQLFTNSSAGVSGLTFFNISGQKAIFRKKKKMNFSLSFTARSVRLDHDWALNEFLGKIVFWKKTLRYLRNKYQINTGYLCKFYEDQLFVKLVNPYFLDVYLQGDSVFLAQGFDSFVVSLLAQTSNVIMGKVLRNYS